MIPARYTLMLNPSSGFGSPYGSGQAAVLNDAGLAEARAVISKWPGYKPTPLIDLAGLANALDIQSLHYKDEGQRFGLKSFKPLGGAYAVARLLMKELPSLANINSIDVETLLAGVHRTQCAAITVTAATDGNHGRSVAWGARMFGCRCVIFINEAVSEGRAGAIAAFGAEVRRNPGSYDDAVRTARATAQARGWHVIPDTTGNILDEAPRHVTQGYALMAAEAIGQLPYRMPPTHLFLQAGVGGMAAASCAQFWQEFGREKPVIVLVEPENSACWFASLEAGHPVALDGDLDSVMGGLACGEVSRVAWAILQTGADAAVKLAEEAAPLTMRLLAEGVQGDRPVVAGESGVAGLAGLLAMADHVDTRQKIGLGPDSRVVVFGTEGATDPDTYTEIVGLHPDKVGT